MELSKDEEEYAYKKHTAFIHGYDSDSDDKSDFDDWYYANKPPPIDIEEYNIIKVCPFISVIPKKRLKLLRKKRNRFKDKPSKTVITGKLKRRKHKIKKSDTDEIYEYKHDKIRLGNHLTCSMNLTKKKKSTKLFSSGDVQPKGLLENANKSKRNKMKNNNILSVTNSELPLTEWPLLEASKDLTCVTGTSKIITNLSAKELKKTCVKPVPFHKSLPLFQQKNLEENAKLSTCIKSDKDCTELKKLNKSQNVTHKVSVKKIKSPKGKMTNYIDHGINICQVVDESKFAVKSKDQDNDNGLRTTKLQENNKSQIQNDLSATMQLTPFEKKEGTQVAQSIEIIDEKNEGINLPNPTVLSISLIPKKSGKTTTKKTKIKQSVEENVTYNQNLNKSKSANNLLYSKSKNWKQNEKMNDRGELFLSKEVKSASLYPLKKSKKGDTLINTPTPRSAASTSLLSETKKRNILPVSNSELSLTEWPLLEVPKELVETGGTVTPIKSVIHSQAKELKQTKHMTLQKSLRIPKQKNLEENAKLSTCLETNKESQSMTVIKIKSPKGKKIIESENNKYQVFEKSKCFVNGTSADSEFTSTNLQDKSKINSSPVQNYSSVTIQSTSIATTKATQVQKSTNIMDKKNEGVNLRTTTVLSASVTPKKSDKTTKKKTNKKQNVEENLVNNHNFNKSKSLNNLKSATNKCKRNENMNGPVEIFLNKEPKSTSLYYLEKSKKSDNLINLPISRSITSTNLLNKRKKHDVLVKKMNSISTQNANVGTCAEANIYQRGRKKTLDTVVEASIEKNQSQNRKTTNEINNCTKSKSINNDNRNSNLLQNLKINSQRKLDDDLPVLVESVQFIKKKGSRLKKSVKKIDCELIQEKNNDESINLQKATVSNTTITHVQSGQTTKTKTKKKQSVQQNMADNNDKSLNNSLAVNTTNFSGSKRRNRKKSNSQESSKNQEVEQVNLSFIQKSKKLDTLKNCAPSSSSNASNSSIKLSTKETKPKLQQETTELQRSYMLPYLQVQNGDILKKEFSDIKLVRRNNFHNVSSRDFDFDMFVSTLVFPFMFLNNDISLKNRPNMPKNLKLTKKS